MYLFLVGIGFVIALTLGILLSRVPSISKYVIPIIGIFQTIPDLFLLVFYLYI